MFKNKKQKMNKNLFKKFAAKGAEIGIAAGIGHAMGKSSEIKKAEQAQLSHQELSDKLDNIQNSVDKVSDKLDNIQNSVDKVNEAITSLPSSNSNNNNKLNFDFNFDFNIDSYYNYLDTLTLSEELALIHILFAILYLLIAFEFVSIFFGNELINYFDLENKYPKLKTFFKLRATYQRYYLIWCLLKLFLLCFILIIFNLIIFL